MFIDWIFFRFELCIIANISMIEIKLHMILAIEWCVYTVLAKYLHVAALKIQSV